MPRRWAVLAILLALGVSVFAVWSARDRAARPPQAGHRPPAPPVPEPAAEQEQKEAADRFVAFPRSPDATVRVLARDDKGRACAGARVRAGVVREDIGMAGPEVEAGADGMAELRVDAAETVGVHVRVGGYNRYTPARIPAGGTTEITVVMPTGARVVGTVRDALRGPVHGAGLSAEFKRGSVTDYLQALTDEEGRFVLAPVPRGECKVSLFLPGRRGKLQDWIRVTAEGEETIDAGTIVVGGAALAGVVRDSATGRPLPGVRVALHDPVSLDTTTDFDGRFRFDDLTPAPFDVSARRAGYGSWSRNDVEVVAGEPAALEIALEPGAVLHVRVRDMDGRPVLGQATLHAYGGGRGRGCTVDLDEEGRGRVVELPPGGYRLTLTGMDLRAEPVQAEIAPGENAVDFAVQRRWWGKGVRSLHGTVRDAATGRPLPGVRVSVFFNPVWTDENGEYVARDLGAGKFRPLLDKDGYGTVHAPEVVIGEGEERRVDYELHPAATLVLELRDGRGRPVAGDIRLHCVRLEPEKSASAMGDFPAGEDGRLVLRRLLPGRHRIDASVPGIGSKELLLTISPGRNEVAVVLVRNTVPN